MTKPGARNSKLPVLNSSHWGAFEPIVSNGRLVGIKPFAKDPDPSSILRSIPGAISHKSRVMRPAIRKGWLENGPGGARDQRGGDSFVAVSWERALDLVAEELKRVIREYGNQAIFGGSYGWGSAGRFHHAKSQLNRFLGAIGGFTNSRDSYSNAAGSVIARRVLGTSQAMNGPGTSWQSIVDNSDLVVAFGGIPIRNTQVRPGGVGEHVARRWLTRAKEAGVAFCNISPMRDDAADFLRARWLAPRPHTDTAILLGLAHTLITEGLHDADFLARYCVGFPQFRDYLIGRADGIPKNAEWAAHISELTPDIIRDLARQMAASRTFIIMNWALQRSDHGEQPIWAAIALASILGQIGLPGGGVGFGYGSMEGVAGMWQDAPSLAPLSGRNPVRSFIPVARIADLLLNPGQQFDYDGQRHTYPNIRLVYWCGGNPFHHHQDLNRLVRAFQQPDTIVVHEAWWTATARHADIVLPATTTLERNDIGGSNRDRFIIAMKQAIKPIAEARDDFEIFADLAERFGCRQAVTEGLTAMELIKYIYEVARAESLTTEFQWPEFEEFWECGYLEIPVGLKPYVLFEDFRGDPESKRLHTASGRIEIFSETIARFEYDDCLGHPAWLEPAEWLGSARTADYPLHLLTTQPEVRLHSQMDMACTSQEKKVAGREPIRINPADASDRGISDGDVVRVFNDRGAALAGAVVTGMIRPGVVQMSTGAWYDPIEPGVPGSLDRHGNPNVLTLDKGTSKLAQGPSAQTALVQVERFGGEVPAIGAFEPPEIDEEHLQGDPS